jgi:hypothetical protein
MILLGSASQVAGITDMYHHACCYLLSVHDLTDSRSLSFIFYWGPSLCRIFC